MLQDKAQKLKQLEEELAKYKAIFIEKKRHYRGVIHESSLSELRHTEYMVYKDMVESLEKEIRELKKKISAI